MTEQEKRIDDLSTLLACIFVEKMKHNGIKYEDIAEALDDAGYRRADEVYNEAYTSGKKDGIIDFVQTVIRCLKNEPYLHTWLREIAFGKFGVEVEE